MKTFVFVSAVCLQLAWSPVNAGHSNGVGAYSYQDSTGNRYGGTYGLKDGEVVDAKGSFPPDFSPPTDFSPVTDFLPPNFYYPEDFTGFYPEFFRNLENLLQDPGYIYNTKIPYYTPITTINLNPSENIASYGGWAYNSEPDYGRSLYNALSDYGGLSPPNYDGLSYKSIPNYGVIPKNVQNVDYSKQYLSRAFRTNLDNKKIALDAAHKAIDLTTNQAGIVTDLNPSRLTPLNDYSGYGTGDFSEMANGPLNGGLPHGFPFEGGIPMPNFGNDANSAYAGAAVGPGYTHQVAAVNPGNPNSPNINKMNSRSGNPGGGSYTSVSSSSYSSSSNTNGKKSSNRQAETVINNNGKITRYSVHSP